MRTALACCALSVDDVNQLGRNTGQSERLRTVTVTTGPPGSLGKLFDAHLLFAALVTRGDVGFVFGIGMEWGR